MAATIALCVFSSAYVFGQIEPYVAEVTGYDNQTAVPEALASNEDQEPEPAEEANDPGQETGVQPTQEPSSGQPTVAPSQPTGTASSFAATHRSNPDFTINFRPGPSVSSGDPLGSLDPNTPLQFLDEEALDEEGVIWLKMQTEGGQIGWIREVDTAPIIQ